MPPRAITAEDFAVLDRFRGITRSFSDIGDIEKIALRSLWKAVAEYGLTLVAGLSAETTLQRHMSILNPNTYVPRNYWTCAYPLSVSNKSYAFQIFIIVGPDGVELGFGAGAARAAGRKPPGEALTMALSQARSALASLADVPLVRRVESWCNANGYRFRKQWMKGPDEGLLPGIGEWIAHASGPDGAEAAISRLLASGEAIALGDGLSEFILGQLRNFVPVMDAIYMGTPGSTSPSDLEVAVMGSGADTLDALVDVTLWPRDRLKLLIETISVSGQVVLSGPPGTGKTWVAKAVAGYLTRNDPERVRTVQLHPSYTYEQFVQGLRPIVSQGMLTFEVADGVVLSIVKRMKDPSQLTILIVDEMNRANLPKVLGELMYLFEYRDEAIDLQYSADFTLPAGLRFLGTMNTADRSTRSIDAALRRRFEIFECPADADILARYYESHVCEVPDLVEGFELLNRQLTADLDEHHAVGHTFFMADPMTSEQLRRFWRHKIKPLVKEYFFDQPELAESYAIEKFWPSVVG